jgi:hypothetical protein
LQKQKIGAKLHIPLGRYVPEEAIRGPISTLGDTAEESAVTAPPFFPDEGRGIVRFWGNEQGPTVFLLHDLGEEGREECERVIRPRKDWVVWSRARPTKGERTPRGFEHVGKTLFCGKANRIKKEQGEPEAEEGMEDAAPNSEVFFFVNVRGRARRQRGWWKRGVVETKLNTVNMTKGVTSQQGTGGSVNSVSGVEDSGKPWE